MTKHCLHTLRRPGRICFHVATEVRSFRFQPDQVWSVNVGVSGWHKQWSLTLRRNDKVQTFPHDSADSKHMQARRPIYTEKRISRASLPHTELNINRDGIGTTEPIAPWLWLAKRK